LFPLILAKNPREKPSVVLDSGSVGSSRQPPLDGHGGYPRTVLSVMDAFELLTSVSQTYRNLVSLALEAWTIRESGDEDSRNRSQVRTIFKYAAPDRLRYEQGGRRGMVQVVDGRQIHTCFNRGPIGRGPRCHSSPMAPERPLPHVFRPELPGAGGNEPFLYQAISEQVALSEIVREEHGCYVAAVTYAESPHPMMLTRMPMLFWIDRETFLVKALLQEVGHRMPAEDEINWTTHNISVQKIEVNLSFPDGTFEFVPPAEAVVTAGQHGFLSGGGGGGFVRFADDDPRHIEHRGSHEWEGETLVEHSKWKLRGTTLIFERRLTFSENSQELEIVERAKSAASETETSCFLRLK
jgi:hypothetical protein